MLDIKTTPQAVRRVTITAEFLYRWLFPDAPAWGITIASRDRMEPSRRQQLATCNNSASGTVEQAKPITEESLKIAENVF